MRCPNESRRGRTDRNIHENPKWRSRGYIPHFDTANAVQSLTFRLADSLPKHVIQIEYEKLDELTTKERIERQKRLEVYLDAGYGECYLRRPAIATLVENALHHFDGERYHLLAWVVMPNHVHAVIKTNSVSLDKILHSWKSFTALGANRHLGRQGTFWPPKQ